MRKVMTAKVGGRYIIVPKLVGLLLVLVALLMFLGATIDLVVSWDKVKDVKECLSAVETTDEVGYLICTTKAVAANVYPFPVTLKDPRMHMDFWRIMSYKAGAWVFWVLVLVIALVIYQTGKIIEFEEEIETARLSVKKEKEEKTKTTRRGRRRKATK